MALAAGRLNKRITIEQKSTTSDGGGGVTETWTTYAEAWAAGEPYSARERLQAQQVEATTDYRWTIRYRADRTFTTKMRVAFGSRTFAIRGILNPGERNEFLVLLCQEEDNEEGL